MESAIICVLVGVMVTIFGYIFEYYFFIFKSPDASRLSTQFVPTTLPAQPIRVPFPTEVECAECHSKNKSDNQLCEQCDNALYEICPKCSYVKPIVEVHCSRCGKSPAELRQVHGLVWWLYTKAVVLCVGAFVILIRTFTLSSQPDPVGVLSVLAILAGSYGLGEEAREDAVWISKSNVWVYRFSWADVTTQKIFYSRNINLAVLLVLPLLVGYGFYIVLAWLLMSGIATT